MNSVSLFARGGYGGFSGRPLAKGDMLELYASSASVEITRASALIPGFEDDVLLDANAPIRVTLGREWCFFANEAQRAFQSEPFRLTPQSDRMGFRLEGPKLALKEALQIDSEAVAFGAIQVPTDGNPIVLMADCQTTGGYPKIAQVCAVDLPRLAQKMPGEALRFVVVDIDTAQRLMLSQARTFSLMEMQ